MSGTATPVRIATPGTGKTSRLRGSQALGNLRPMNDKWRIVGLIAVAVLAAWLALRSCTPQQQSVELPPPPARELFHASKPIQISVVTADDARYADDPEDTPDHTRGIARRSADEGDAPGAPAANAVRVDPENAWLEFELRRLLSRARMRVAPVTSERATDHYTLRIELGGGGMTLALVAPDGVIERREPVAGEDGKLATLSAIAARLPAFLDAGHAQRDWVAFIGTGDPQALESYENAALSILGPDGHGFTRPPRQRRDRTIEHLEILVRRHPDFARAWAALSAGYLSQGGEDERSLTQLAQSSAERALSLDGGLADAHAALGLVHLRRGEWIAARERFDQALALDINNAPALEGLACLLVDAGYYADAHPIALRSLALQAHNTGAQECLAYADLRPAVTPADAPAFAAGKQTGRPENPGAGSAPNSAASGQATAPASAPGAPPPAGGQPRSGTDAVPASTPAAQARALALILNADLPSARDMLRASLNTRDFNEWAAPLLKAAGNPRQVPGALQAVTRAANEQRIDAATEILCGTALRQVEFVFNRITRLQHQRGHVPLRILWMPETAFLRQSRHFDKIIADTGIGAYWQEHGAPDICAVETAHVLCKPRSSPVGRSRS